MKLTEKLLKKNNDEDEDEDDEDDFAKRQTLYQERRDARFKNL